MPCPFPGMDPFLERPEIWPDFHDSLIAYIREALQPLLRPRYVALTQDRLFVVESERPIRPDVSIFPTGPSYTPLQSSSSAIADTATVVELFREEVNQSYLEIIEPASGNQVVTAIEVLSPDNKTPGAGLVSYRRKQQELWDGGTSLIEIDLLKAGARSMRVKVPPTTVACHKRYLVAVSRFYPTQCEFYGFGIEERLPRISVPLQFEDADIVLDLQSVFTRCYESGPYPQLLYYDQAAPSLLTDQEQTFVQQRMPQ